MPQSRSAITARPLIIGNPTAGLGAGRSSRTRLIESATQELSRGGTPVEVWLEENSQTISQLGERGVREGYDPIIAAGGDGTVNAVINGMMRAARGQPLRVSSSLGVLPLGTGNVLAFNLGIPRALRGACKVLREGHRRSIDVGLARAPAAKDGRIVAGRDRKRRHFLLMAGIGFDARVVEETSLRLKYVLRDFAYVLKTLQNVVLHRGSQVTLEMGDGHIYANVAWLVMIGNAASYAWDIKVTAQAQMDDGCLDVCLMPFENNLYSIQQALQVLIGQHLERGTAQYWQTESVRVLSDPPVPVQLDGDEWTYTPVEFSVLPHALQVLAPPVDSNP